MAQVDVQTTAVRLEDLLTRAEQGEEVVITRGGRPVARLVPLAPLTPRRFGLIRLNVPDDFDEPLTHDEG